jgi:Fe-S cluster biogenesis protein NfuA
MLSKDAVEKVLNEKIRPGLMMDGGNIDLVKVEDNKVYVKLVGACHGCPGAQMTLQMGVERILRSEFTELEAVVPV